MPKGSDYEKTKRHRRMRLGTCHNSSQKPRHVVMVKEARTRSNAPRTMKVNLTYFKRVRQLYYVATHPHMHNSSVKEWKDMTENEREAIRQRLGVG